MKTYEITLRSSAHEAGLIAREIQLVCPEIGRMVTLMFHKESFAKLWMMRHVIGMKGTTFDVIQCRLNVQTNDIEKWLEEAMNVKFTEDDESFGLVSKNDEHHFYFENQEAKAQWMSENLVKLAPAEASEVVKRQIEGRIDRKP